MDDGGEDVILVDMDDREVGRAAKLPTHKMGYLHRAISVCVVDSAGRMLLQRRASGKYHSAGLWTNACCTHPRPGEAADRAASRRLREELGVVCPLNWMARTHYRASVAPDLVENEVVHLFIGLYGGAVRPDADEVDAFDWVARGLLLSQMRESPDAYSPWFRHYLSSFGNALFQKPGA
jgi:isopentenyl-diphosphate delta-isomerase